MLSIASLLVFGVSLLPLLYMCRYVHASGDDYGYGALTHAAWLDTGSLMEVFRAAAETVKHYYYGWQGTWSTIFLFSLQPEVFSPNGYWIVPILMISLTAMGVSILVYHLLVSRIGLPRWTFVTVDCCLLFAMLQFVPRTKSAIFWYNGTVHYVVPFFWAMIAIYCYFKFIDTRRVRYWLLSLVCMFLLGGASYLAALLAPMVLLYLLLLYGKRKPYSLWLLLPLAVEGAGLAVSMLAPGNWVRGGESMDFSLGKVIGTIATCFVRGFVTLGEYASERPLAYLLLFLMGAVVWMGLNEKKVSFSFKWPFLFVGLMFCTWCAMFAPEIYSMADVSGGVPNTVFWVFLLTAAASWIYLLGWLHGKLEARCGAAGRKPFYLDREKGWFAILAPVVVLCGISLLVFRSDVRGCTAGVCVEYVLSGQADDYQAQMEERLAVLLDDSVKDVELYQINAEQGPLMHMEVLEDPDAWTNQVACQFFRKDRIVGGKVREN